MILPFSGIFYAHSSNSLSFFARFMPVFFQFFPAQGGGIALRGRENGEFVAGDGAGDRIPVDPEMNVPDLAQYTSLTLDQGLLQGPKTEEILVTPHRFAFIRR